MKYISYLFIIFTFLFHINENGFLYSYQDM